MTSRERVMAALSRRQPDVLPLGFKATDDVIGNLLRHLNAAGLSDLLALLSVDTWGGFNNTTWGIFPRYAGPQTKVLYPNTRADGSWDSIFGYRRRWTSAAVGRNDEVITHPLADVQSPAGVEKHDWPQTAWFDYSTIPAQCADAGDRAIIFIVGGLGHFANLTGYTRYLEEMVLNPALVEAGHARLTEFYLEHTSRALQAAAGRIDIICLQDDFVSQQGLLISKEMYRRFYKPYHERIYDMGHRHGALAMHHSCGAVFDLIPEFLDISCERWSGIPAIPAL